MQAEHWKLSWSVAEEIRALVKQGVAQKDLAASYKVSKANIWMIVVGRIYKRPPRTPEERAATKAKLARACPRKGVRYHARGYRSLGHNMPHLW